MLSFQEYLSEAFKNFIGYDESVIEQKRKYVDEVWDILQSSYEPIGGIKGSGFNSKEDMIRNIPFWKLLVKNGKVEIVLMYKDKNGRKTVALGTTGSDYAKKNLVRVVGDDISRSYGEKSKSALGFVLKNTPRDILEPFILGPNDASKMIKKDVTPISDIPKDEWPEDAVVTINKFPWIEKYGYLRDLGGKMTFKVLIGSPGNKIRY